MPQPVCRSRRLDATELSLQGGVSITMMPNFARLRGLTYWSQLFVDMREQKILNDENGDEGDTVEVGQPARENVHWTHPHYAGP